MLFSKAGEYGLQAMLHLAAAGDEGFVTVRALADRCSAPYHFLSKICHRLGRAGLLDSSRGPHGGVRLARPAAEITLLEAVQAIDGLDGFDRCVLGLEPCRNDLPCPIHAHWLDVKEKALDMLACQKLGELVEDLHAGRATLEKTERSSA